VNRPAHLTLCEEPEPVLAAAGRLVGHVQLADAPGRYEPGTGKVAWARQLSALRAAGYSGPIRLQYVPNRYTPWSLEHIWLDL
jgi:hydroxypyruvate isomerase